MAHTHTLLLYHIIFSTQRRVPMLSPEIRSVVFPYMSGIIANNGGESYIINGVEDHVHILCRLKSKPDVADIVHDIKGGTSSWFNKQPGVTSLHWQVGYGAFTVSYSQLNRVFKYIENQQEHHREKTFAEEYEGFLKRHRISYDPRFMLD
jgi:putative transposase